jgi:hypothetical protein
METKHTKIRLKIKLINCGRLPFSPPHIFETVRTTTNVKPYFNVSKMRNEYIDIGGIVDHHCFNVLFIINVFFLKIKT